MSKADEIISVNLNRKMKPKWWMWMCSLSELHQFTLDPTFKDREDAQEILEFLDRMGSVRPEDINSNLFG